MKSKLQANIHRANLLEKPDLMNVPLFFFNFSLLRSSI